LTFFRFALGISQGPENYTGGSLLRPMRQGANLNLQTRLIYPSSYYNLDFNARNLLDFDSFTDWASEPGGGFNPQALTVAYLTSDVPDIDSFTFTARRTYPD